MKNISLHANLAASGRLQLNKLLLNISVALAWVAILLASAVTSAYAQTGGTPGVVFTVAVFGTGSTDGVGLIFRGAGRVVSSPEGIDCIDDYSATCTAVFPVGTNVTLTATPDAKSAFVSWDEAGVKTNALTRTFVMTGNSLVQAFFAPNATRLKVSYGSVYGIGTIVSTPPGINCPLSYPCEADFPLGTTVILKATPDAGSYISGWGGTGVVGVAQTLAVEMTQPRDVSAVFVLGPKLVSISKAGTGDGTVTSTDGAIGCGTVCGASVSFVSGIQLNARAAQGSVFAGWSGADCSGTGSCTVSPFRDVVVTAIFNRSLLPPKPNAPFDFNVDGKSDLLLRNAVGSISGWYMHGTSISSSFNLLANDPSTAITHTGDFNGDGTEDILWRKTDGSVNMWLLNANTVVGSALLLGPNSGWRASQIADFNGDGKADILWRHTDGRIAMWLMNGTTFISGAGLLEAASGWTVTHTADSNGDGRADILFRHTDGRVAMWLMNGLTLSSGAGLLEANSGWTISHTGDFNGDGKADIVFRHTDGRVAMWLMNGLALTSGAGLLNAASGWTVTHTADFNGDGTADLLFQHTDGRVAMWLMSGTNLISGAGLLGVASGWSVARTGDYNGDGNADLVFVHTDGRIAMWLMNGTTLTSGAGLTGPGSGLVLVP